MARQKTPQRTPRHESNLQRQKARTKQRRRAWRQAKAMGTHPVDLVVLAEATGGGGQP